MNKRATPGKQMRPFDASFFAQLETLRLVSNRPSRGDRPGERRGRRHGSSLDFTDFRPYTQGDELRLIDWNIYGRLGRLVVKLFNEERDQCLHLLVDDAESMGVGNPSKLVQAARLAGALAYVGLANHERVAMGNLGGGASASVRPQGGKQRMPSFLSALESLTPAGSGALGTSIAEYAASHARTGGIAVVISDLLEPIANIESGLRALVVRGFEVQLVQVLSEEELHPSWRGDFRLLAFGSAVDADARDVTVDADSLAQYAANLQTHFTQIEQLARKWRIPFVRFSDADSIPELVLRRLREKRMLK